MAIKRLFDIVIALCALLVTWPLILISALMIKSTSSGPVFYRAKRAGFGGRPFHMLKLRTMYVGMDNPDQRVTAVQDDRITPAGKVLRQLKIDELPQFWNVLRGEMSIVGPRPEDWEIVQRYYTVEYRHTLDVRPGIVSPVDLRWYPDLTYHDPPPPEVPIQEHYLKRHMPIQVAEALRYVERRNLWLDLKVIGQTIYCVLVHFWLPPKRRALPLDNATAGQSLTSLQAIKESN